MAEYIEREATKQKIGDLHFQNYGIAITAIMEMPAADVVEVVRCKDCLFSLKEPDYEYGYMCYKGVYHPCIGETRHRKLVQDIDFCSHGKRKEGAEG